MSTPATKEVVRYQDENQITRAGTRYKEQVEALKITSAETYQQMVALVRVSKGYQQAVKDFFEPIRAPQYEALEATYKKIRDNSKPFADAETIGKQRMRGWEQLEAKRQADADRRAEEKRKAAAAEARQNGNEEKAQTIEAALPVQRENRAHVEGVQYVDNWKARLAGATEEDRLASLRELLKAILAGKASIGFVLLDESEINRFAKATSGKMPIPGLEFYNEKTVKVGK